MKRHIKQGVVTYTLITCVTQVTRKYKQFVDLNESSKAVCYNEQVTFKNFMYFYIHRNVTGKDMIRINLLIF